MIITTNYVQYGPPPKKKLSGLSGTQTYDLWLDDHCSTCTIRGLQILSNKMGRGSLLPTGKKWQGDRGKGARETSVVKLWVPFDGLNICQNTCLLRRCFEFPLAMIKRERARVTWKRARSARDQRHPGTRQPEHPSNHLITTLTTNGSINFKPTHPHAPRHLVVICLLLSKLWQMPHGGASFHKQMPHSGARLHIQMPHSGARLHMQMPHCGASLRVQMPHGGASERVK